jgi:hypothetical protein
VNLDKHLLEQHTTPARLRKEIVQHFAHYERTDLRAIELPEQPAGPIKELGTPLAGLCCKTCCFLTVNLTNMRRRIGPNPRRIRLSVRVSHPRMEVRQVRSVSLDTPDPFTSAHLTHKHCIQKRRARIESIDRKLCDISQCLNTTTMELQSWDSRAPTPQQDNNSNDSNRSTNDSNRSTNTSYKLPKLSLNNYTTIICFLAEFGVLVCKQHRTAVVNLDVHLRDQHATPAVLRKQIIEQLCNFTIINGRRNKTLSI